MMRSFAAKALKIINQRGHKKPHSQNSLKISVITPSYNSESCIEKAIQSVVAQSYKNYEHIIVDGASTDGTVNILKKYPHLKWISERDRGQVDALNKGFSMSTGEVIVYLNSDDYFCKGAFSEVIPYFEKGEKMVMGKVLVVSEKPEGIREWINDPKVDFASMLRHWEQDAFCVNPVGYFFRRELQEEIGGFNVENDARHDLEFLLELALRCNAKKINKVLGVFNHSFDTKTGLSQLKPSSWNIDSRPFIDRLAKNLSADKLQKFQLDRERGYQLRRYWTIEECFARGISQELIDEGEILLLPEEVSGSVKFNRPAAKGDWVIVLLSMSEVAGHSIYKELKKLPIQTLPAQVYYTHSINNKKIDEDVASRLPSGIQDSTGLAISDILRKNGNALKWKFISGVRDPIACALSLFDKKSHIESDKLKSKIIDHLDYFDSQYKNSLGIDVYKYPFDHKQGYVIIKKNNIEILIYRFEDLPRIYTQAMEEFLGISALKSPRLNSDSQKEYTEISYRAKRGFRFDESLLDAACSSWRVRHFYTGEEIDSFYKRWQR